MTNRDSTEGKGAAPTRPTREAVREPPEKERAPGERIAKRMARAGLCSRREAEAWIRAGRVTVDGRKLDSPALTVTAASRIAVDGKPLPAAEPARLWRYHKPRGLLTTNRDIRGRPIIFDHLPADLPRVVTVGRLDMNSEGLLLLTNDGELARRLELPATGWVRRYRVRVRGQVDVARLEALAKGIEIEGVRYGPIRAELDRQLDNNAWLSMGLNEGKNRELRRVCEHLGWPVLRLIRVAYGPFQLGNMAQGEVSEAPASVLRDQLGGERKGRGKAARSPERKPPPLVGGGRGRGAPPAGGEKDASSPASHTPTPALPHQGGGGKKAPKTRRDGSALKAKHPSRRASGPPQDEGGRVARNVKATKKKTSPTHPHPEEARSAVSKDRPGGKKAPSARRKSPNPDAHHRR